MAAGRGRTQCTAQKARVENHHATIPRAALASAVKARAASTCRPASAYRSVPIPYPQPQRGSITFVGLFQKPNGVNRPR
jgi:hypothetical protein